MQPVSRSDDQPEPGPDAKHGRNLPVAIATGVGLGGLVIGTLFWNFLAYTVLVTAAVLVAVFDLSTLAMPKSMILTCSSPSPRSCSIMFSGFRSR